MIRSYRIRHWVSGVALLGLVAALPGGARAMTHAGATIAASGPAQGSWRAAQTAFMATVRQSAQGAATRARWQAFVTALSAYVRTSPEWTAPAMRVQQDLARGSAPMGYTVTDWGAGLTRIRLVSVSDLGLDFARHINVCVYNQLPYPVYAARILVWLDHTGAVHTQTLAQNIAGTDVMVRGSFIDPGFTPTNARAWGEQTGTLHMALVVEEACGGSGGTFPTLHGAALPAGAPAWAADPAMFPPDVERADFGFIRITFTDPAGMVVRIDAAQFSAVFDECNACLHAEAYRVLTRTGNVYHAQPWRTVPGPYPTLVQAVGVVQKTQPQGGGACASGLHGLVTGSAVATGLCAVRWGKPQVESVDVNPFPPYKNVATTFTVRASTTMVIVTVMPSAAGWLVSQVHIKG